LTVAIDAEGAERERLATATREAARYWAAHPEYLDDPVPIRIVDGDADADADVVVAATATLDDCDGVADAAGCAPLVTDGPVDRPVHLRVRRDLRVDSTALVVTHEFGHLFGLTHDDDPASVMAASRVVYTRPRPNATAVAFPWADRSFAVHVDATNASDPVRVHWQVRYALAYFERGTAPGVPATLSFESVDDPADADVVVRVATGVGNGTGTATATGNGATACADGAGSCARTRGPDPDGDGAVESYERLTVTLVGVDEAAVGWHVGYWLAYGFGAEADAEKPPPFREATYAERRSRWWEATTRTPAAVDGAPRAALPRDGDP
jgi:hypothetical protein